MVVPNDLVTSIRARRPCGDFLSVATLEDLATGVAGWADFTFMVTRQDADACADTSSTAATLEDYSLLMVVTHQHVLAEGGTNSSMPPGVKPYAAARHQHIPFLLQARRCVGAWPPYVLLGFGVV